ncbi:unnamed protein product [Protopolystoma xenopodis]|uniref:Uncharacterized protein n=1 Tax=Protopolystoma xenopodis TaxID=117903 RepID=A0A3S5AF13_9PLAT|nr:unnamed protein product [Protopolystoma xenopodis]
MSASESSEVRIFTKPGASPHLDGTRAPSWRRRSFEYLSTASSDQTVSLQPDGGVSMTCAIWPGFCDSVGWYQHSCTHLEASVSLALLQTRPDTIARGRPTRASLRSRKRGEKCHRRVLMLSDNSAVRSMESQAFHALLPRLICFLSMHPVIFYGRSTLSKSLSFCRPAHPSLHRSIEALRLHDAGVTG